MATARRGLLFQFSVSVLQIIDGLYQLSQSTRLDSVPSLLEVHDGGPGNSRLAPETLSGGRGSLS